MPIKDLTEKRRMPRLGKIHLGTRHPEKGYPIKTDYFVCPPEVEKVFGKTPKCLRILIPVEDEEKWCSQYYRCYSKTRGLICKGDGETAMRMVDSQSGAMADRDSKAVEMREMSCEGRKCPDYGLKCKEVMNLQFLLPEVPGLGIWQIDTSSINSIKNINSMAELLKSIYGRISMKPLLLTLEPKEVNNPKDGKKQTVYVLNLRTDSTLIEMSAQAKQLQAQLGVLALPAPDDERPELISPEYEPDEVDLPPYPRGEEQAQKDINELFEPGGHSEKTEPNENKEPQSKAVTEPSSENKQPDQPKYDFDETWLKSLLKEIRWSDSTLKSWLVSHYQLDVSKGTVTVLVAKLTKEQRQQLFKELEDRKVMSK